MFNSFFVKEIRAKLDKAGELAEHKDLVIVVVVQPLLEESPERGVKIMKRSALNRAEDSAPLPHSHHGHHLGGRNHPVLLLVIVALVGVMLSLSFAFPRLGFDVRLFVVSIRQFGL